MHICTSLRIPVSLLSLLFAGCASAQLARLVSAFPQPGIWWNPAAPGTALLWENEGGQEWRAQVLEYDDYGNSTWLDLKGDSLRYRDPAQVADGAGYVRAVGALSRVRITRCEPTDACPELQGTVQRTDHVGAAEIEFLDPNHARWKRNGEVIPIEHVQVSGFGGLTIGAGQTYLLIAHRAMRTSGQAAASHAFVRANTDPLTVGANGWHLQCLDCGTSGPGLLPAALVDSLRIACAPRCALHSKAGTAGWLNLPYANRLRAVAQAQDAEFDDVLLLPVAPGFAWRSDDMPRPLQLTAYNDPGVLLGRASARYPGIGYRHAHIPYYHLLLGHGSDGLPIWWSAQRAQGPCEYPLREPTDRPCFVRNRGTGTFAKAVVRWDSQSADLHYRYVVEDRDPYLRLSPNDSSFFVSQQFDANSFTGQSPPPLTPPDSSSSGILIVRAPLYELRARVALRWSSIEPHDLRLQCLDCAQAGVAGDVVTAERRLHAVLAAFRGYSISSELRFDLDDGGQRRVYRLQIGNRQSDELLWQRLDFADEAPPGPEIPVTLQYFPLVDQ